MTQIPEWFIKLLIAVALPTITCFGYYSLDYLDNPDTVTTLFVVLAYPLALLALVGLFRTVLSANPARWGLFLWGASLLVLIAILVWLRI